MNVNFTPKERNQAARVTSQFLAEKGIALKHSEALDLVARLTGHKNHMAAKGMNGGPATTLSSNIAEMLTQSSVQAALSTIPEVASIYDACMQELAASLPLEDLKRLELPVLLKAYQRLPTTAPIESASEGNWGLTEKEYAAANRLSEAYAYKTQYLAMLRQRVRLQFELATAEGLGASHGLDKLQTAAEIYSLVDELNEEHDIGISLGDHVVYSLSEEGYWNGGFGWVDDMLSATGYVQKSSAILDRISALTRVPDLRWEEIILEDTDFYVD